MAIKKSNGYISNLMLMVTDPFNVFISIILFIFVYIGYIIMVIVGIW